MKVKIGPGSLRFLSYWCNSQDADGMEREKKEEKIREEKRREKRDWVRRIDRETLMTYGNI